MLRDAMLGAAVGALIPIAVILGYQWLRGREGMGWGDVKLLAMLGAFLGWRGMLMTLVLGSLAGGTVGLGLIALGRGKSDTELPFGTFLCVAARAGGVLGARARAAPGVGRAMTLGAAVAPLPRSEAADRRVVTHARGDGGGGDGWAC